MSKNSVLYHLYQHPLCYFFIPLCLYNSSLSAVSLDSPAALTNGGSAMYTVQDIYNRLDQGTPGSKRTTSFIEPSTGPGATGNDLNDIMKKAPSIDDTNGATASDVANGKTYWGLKSGGDWGLKTGSSSTQTSIPMPVAKTGQNLCYRTDGNIGTITCDGTTGQDGDSNMQSGMAHSSSRFTDNSDGTITDNSTGLIWLKNANCAGKANTWGNALIYVAQLNTDGTINSNNCGDSSNSGTHQTDWRLPNIKELHSLVDFQNTNPALPSVNPFLSVKPNGYWSSTSNAGYSDYAWGIFLYLGGAGSDKKIVSNYVWPVRGGQ